MVGYIKSVFFDNNIKIINRKPTRTEANKKSVLDHFYTNHPKKIKCVEQNDDTNSDHSMLKILRHMKVTQSEEQYTFTRDYKKIDFDRVNQEIMDSDIYFEILESENPDYIAENIIELINSKLDDQSKLKKIKIKKKEETYFSQKIEELVHRKKIVYQKWVSDKNPEDKRELKNMKALIKKEKSNFEYLRKKSEFEKCENDPVKMWKTAKKTNFWKRK